MFAPVVLKTSKRKQAPDVADFARGQAAKNAREA
jgi:hypothetical protein